MLLCEKNSLILVLSLLEESIVPVGHAENLLLPSFLPTPLLLRGKEKRLVAMVLASSREAEAPGEVYHRVIMGARTALGYSRNRVLVE